MIAIRTAATLIVLILTAAPAAHAQVPPPPKTSVHIDPASPLDSRVGEADPSVLKMFADAGRPAPSAHVLTDGERLLDKTAPDGKKETIKLPDERNGLAMVFKAFDKVSYALILRVNDGGKVGDRLVNPK